MKHFNRRGGLSILVAITAVLAVPAFASAATVGTPSSGITARALVDTYSNFSLVDSTQTATAAGAVTTFNYYAQATGTIEFLITDSSYNVTYVSPGVLVTATGSHTYSPPTAASVNVGDHIGYYTSGTGVIPFDYITPPSVAPAINYTANGGGTGTVGQPLQFEGSSARTYSLGATTTATASTACVVTAARAASSSPSGHAEQDVTVSNPFGLASVSSVVVSNGHVFTGGSAGTQIDPAGTTFTGNPTSVVLTAVKTNPALKTVWSFNVTDSLGHTTHCV